MIKKLVYTLIVLSFACNVFAYDTEKNNNTLEKYFNNNDEIIKKKDNILYTITYSNYSLSCNVGVKNFELNTYKTFKLDYNECLVLLKDLNQQSLASRFISIILLVFILTIISIFISKTKPIFNKIKNNIKNITISSNLIALIIIFLGILIAYIIYYIKQ